MKNKVSAIAVVLLMLSSLASADWMNYNGVGLNEIVTTHSPGLLADGLTVYAGQEYVNFDGNNYIGYCVDLNHYSTSADVIVKPVTEYAGGVRGREIAYLFNTYASGVTTGSQAAALGVAIWELVAETTSTLDVTSGYFYITGNDGVAADANVLLADADNHSLYSVLNMPVVFYSPTAQSFVVAGENDIPEPATMSLLALGSLVILRRKTAAVGQVIG